MALQNLWVLHLDHGHLRYYFLEDMEEKEDRPYFPRNINTEGVPGCWALSISGTEPTSWHRFTDPVEIDENNFITIFNFSEGQQKIAVKRMNEFTHQKDSSVCSGSSP